MKNIVRARGTTLKKDKLWPYRPRKSEKSSELNNQEDTDEEEVIGNFKDDFCYRQVMATFKTTNVSVDDPIDSTDNETRDLGTNQSQNGHKLQVDFVNSEQSNEKLTNSQSETVSKYQTVNVNLPDDCSNDAIKNNQNVTKLKKGFQVNLSSNCVKNATKRRSCQLSLAEKKAKFEEPSDCTDDESRDFGTNETENHLKSQITLMNSEKPTEKLTNSQCSNDTMNVNHDQVCTCILCFI